MSQAGSGDTDRNENLTQVHADIIRRLPLLAGLSDDDIRWLAESASPLAIRAGDILIEEGSPAGPLYIVLEGEFEVSKRVDKQAVVLDHVGPGKVLGETAPLLQVPRMATVRAVRDSRLLMISMEAFQQLLTSSPTATLALLHTVTSRLRNTEVMLRQSAKMAALGTLAAGLAHELNNPAAAISSSVAQLRQAVADLQCMTGITLTPEQQKVLTTLEQETARRASSPALLDPLTRSDKEDEIQAWLEACGVQRAWTMTPTLVSLGWDVAALDEIGSNFEPAQVPSVLTWLTANATIYLLLDEVARSAERMSTIVAAVKSYSYLDQAPIQQVDVRKGLDDTLIILQHRIRHGIQVRREYAPDIPMIEAYGSELNQVWTNIMDNAIDAMKEHGHLLVRAFADGQHVVVEICDDGPGIPPAVQSRIFEPFFTTKALGEGTGLGLHISYNIVHRHGGDINVRSRPGETCFRVSLPVRLPHD